MCNLPELPVNLLDTSSLDATITIEEVRYALLKANKGKALGNDQMPLEVINNQTCTLFLLKLFNFCFREWSRGVISPILKDVNADPRDPLNYRGITITSLQGWGQVQYLYLSTYLSVLEYLVYGNVKVLVLVLVLDQKVLGTYK